ncbi:tetratricopeptide (TPR) repeat protein [Arthrobacter stackebrandtii]|uniref:Tetratricopeptide (TPR) repeat protein n=1 Tax=Arthrobacter stackebrandtii TaxID=272161 RepID=A0ABS4Z0L0_9MICC|nr:ATP-binding protein [Arthrobacter stackebrandtii]MBP2414252.1 tetratricopeptide (TPR) repeat protein [Arthrobacter stackebrandtii]
MAVNVGVIHEVRMSRARLYILIDSFEQDMRFAIEAHLLDHMDEEAVFTSKELEAMRSKQAQDESGQDAGIVHYLDLSPSYDILLRHKELLPTDLATDLKLSASIISQLVPIRHRVMHGRPLNINDQATTVTLLSPFTGQFWTNTHYIINKLRQDPSWEPVFERTLSPQERTLHNLPEADYDETSFIGRKVESAWLLAALRKRRNPIITITGEGGIGKTALTLDVAYRLVDSDENPYEAILWVSLKTEKLTASGVELLRDAVRGIDDTIQYLGQTLTNDFSGSATELADALEGIECLIIIDNLESANGDEIVQLYDILPDSVTFLFTSRVGIGQLERRYALPALNDSEAVLLLRKFASAHGQHKLTKLKQADALEVVNSLRCSPLAIRWYVLAAASGAIPTDVLKNQQELLNFCVQNVHEGLSENSKAVLNVLRALDRRIGFDEFAVLTDLSIDDLRMVTQELTRGSLVSVESITAGQPGSKLALTPTARLYLKKPDHSGTFIAEVLRRERQYKTMLEASLSTTKSVDPRIINPRSESDSPAVFMLQRALKMAYTGNAEKAEELVGRARTFNPDFSEVHRVSGDIQSRFARYESAVSDYQTALSFASTDAAIVIASYQLASVFGYRLHIANVALPHAERAFELAPNLDTTTLYGKILVWTGDFEAGHLRLREALSGATGRDRLMIGTALANAYSRWGESFMKTHSYADAFAKSTEGLLSGWELTNYGKADQKLSAALAECCIVALRALEHDSSLHGDTTDGHLSKIASFLVQSSKLIPTKKRELIFATLNNVLIEMDNSTPVYAELYAGYLAVNMGKSIPAP